MTFRYPLIYTGNADLLDALRGPLEVDFKILRPETPEANEAVASGEYATITYTGGEYATIADYPEIAPRTVAIAIAPNGHIHTDLTIAVLMSHFEMWNDGGVTEAAAAAARYRQTGKADPA